MDAARARAAMRCLKQPAYRRRRAIIVVCRTSNVQKGTNCRRLRRKLAEGDLRRPSEFGQPSATRVGFDTEQRKRLPPTIDPMGCEATSTQLSTHSRYGLARF